MANRRCNTPTYPPQSNDIHEDFNGTFKRDVYERCQGNPDIVQKQL